MLQATNDDPPPSAFDVVPHDTDLLPHITRALWVGVLGDVRVMFANDTVAVTLVNAQGLVSGRITRVFATGTTATNIVGLR